MSVLAVPKLIGTLEIQFRCIECKVTVETGSARYKFLNKAIGDYVYLFFNNDYQCFHIFTHTPIESYQILRGSYPLLSDHLS